VPDIELKRIQPNRLNPRLEFSKAGLDELAASIRQVGLLEPIMVRPKDDQYEVVVGERRYRAAQQAGLDKVPVTIRDYTDDQVMELNLIENIQREDLSAVEKAKLCKRMKDSFPAKYQTWEAIAQKIGVDFETIKKWIRILGLPEEIQQRIAPREIQRVSPGKIDYQTALRITQRIKEPKKQIELAERLAEKHTTQRTATKIIKEVSKKPSESVERIFHEVVKEAPIFLPFSKIHADTILKEIKTQTSRKTKDPRLEKGVIVRAQVTHFADLEVTDVYRKKLGNFDEEDARREGGYTLEEFKQVWKELHGEWNPNESVYIIRFRLKSVVGEPDSPG
jgi:ParB/RepB/Spo0J family partition protein